MALSIILPSTVRVVAQQSYHLLVVAGLSKSVGHAFGVYGTVVSKKDVTSACTGGEFNERLHRTRHAHPSVVAALRSTTWVITLAATMMGVNDTISHEFCCSHHSRRVPLPVLVYASVDIEEPGCLSCAVGCGCFQLLCTLNHQGLHCLDLESYRL